MSLLFILLPWLSNDLLWGMNKLKRGLWCDICMHICICVCMYIYLCICICICVCIYIYICVCIYIYICGRVRLSRDSSVWLKLTSREQLMSTECSMHQVLSFAKMLVVWWKNKEYSVYIVCSLYIYIYIYIYNMYIILYI